MSLLKKMVSKYNIETSKIIKLNYLVNVMKFKAVEYDEFSIGLIKGQKAIKIHYDLNSDLYNIELIKFNSLKKQLETRKNIKSNEKIKGLFWEDLRENIERFLNTQIYNLL